jgi:hypothetical protein
MHESDEKCVQFPLKNLRGRDYMADLEVNGSIILKRILMKQDRTVGREFLK